MKNTENNTSPMMLVGILLLIAALSALVYFVVLPMLKGGTTKTTNEGPTRNDQPVNQPPPRNTPALPKNDPPPANTDISDYEAEKSKAVVSLTVKGAKVAQKLINRALSAYSISQPPLKVDGKIGPKSKAAIQAVIEAIPAPMRTKQVSAVTMEDLLSYINARTQPLHPNMTLFYL